PAPGRPDGPRASAAPAAPVRPGDAFGLAPAGADGGRAAAPGRQAGRAAARSAARPKRRGLVAAAVAAGVVLVGGGVTYGLMDRTAGDQVADGGQRPDGKASDEPGRVLDDPAGTAGPTATKTPGPGDSSRPGDAGSATAGTPSGRPSDEGGTPGTSGTEPSTRTGGDPARTPGAKATTSAPTTAAPPPPATSGGCTASGSSSTCQVVSTATSTRYDGGEMGTVAPGPQLFYCQVDLDHSETYGGRTSRWWARTDDDDGNTNVYVSVLHLSGGGAGGPVEGLRIC
ncbi:hypothetical protein ACWEV0_20160, partial [Streptomyces sp. NPDC003943]